MITTEEQASPAISGNLFAILRYVFISAWGYVVAVAVSTSLILISLSAINLALEPRYLMLVTRMMENPQHALKVVCISLLIVMAYTMVFASPGFVTTLLFAHRKTFLHSRQFAIGGLLTAVLALLLFLLLQLMSKGSLSELRLLPAIPFILCSLIGGLTGGVTYWLVTRNLLYLKQQLDSDQT